MRVAVCDNSQEDRTKIKGLIEEYGRKNGHTMEIREYESGKALLESAWLRACSIVFLNMNAKEGGLLKTAKRLKESNPGLCVILVSARMSDALDGYRVKAERFLIKEDIETKLPECLSEVLKELVQKNEKLSFSFVEGERLLDVSDIFYVETDRHKNIFYTARASYRIYKKLDEIEQQLAPYGFVRVHRSFLVNMKYIRKISSYVLHLAEGTGKAENTVEISVPKSRYAYVKREYAAYQERH
ncbi:MAG: LytTR family DNA-binding domain-containing protein [Lachnospiraceae bacterium]|nr:LytTR family DNA-binding domain-containing protein [Lachnospiraceae bacterium]